MVLDYKIKNLFFDRRIVTERVDRGRVKALSKIGAFTRRKMRSLMRRRKRVSRPGEPPSAHVGTLKEKIFFGLDPASDSVVVGPVKTNQIFFNGSGRPVRGTVPEVLDKGGEIHIFERFSKSRNEWVRIDLRRRRPAPGTPLRLRKVTIAARPFTQPALTEVMSNKKLEQAFKDIM